MTDAELEALAELEGVPVEALRAALAAHVAPAPEAPVHVAAAPAPEAAPRIRDGVTLHGNYCAVVTAAPQRRDPLGLLGMLRGGRRVGL